MRICLGDCVSGWKLYGVCFFRRVFFGVSVSITCQECDGLGVIGCADDQSECYLVACPKCG